MNFLFHHRVSAFQAQKFYAETSGLGRVELKMLAKAVSTLGFKVDGGEYGFDDVVMILQTIGLNPMPSKIKSIYRGMKIPVGKSLTFGEISHVWARFLHERKHEEKMIQLAFEYFDKDDSGYITSDEFVAAMSELGDPLTEQEVGTFLKHFDVDSDGKIQYSEFLKAIQSQAEKVHFILGSGISGDEEEEKGKDLKDSLKEATKGD